MNDKEIDTTKNLNDLALAQTPRENAGDTPRIQATPHVETEGEAAVASSALFGLESFTPTGHPPFNYDVDLTPISWSDKP